MAKLFGAQRLVLQAIHDSPKDAAGFVADSEIAQRTSIALKDVGDWIETLEQEDFIEVARTVTGLRASVTANGRLALGQYRPFSVTTPDSPTKSGARGIPGTSQPPVAVLIDEAHGQLEWFEHPTASIGFKEAMDTLREFCSIKVNKSNSFTTDLLEGIDVIILPTPLDAELGDTECDAIARWVLEGHGLLILGTYLMEAHHKINLNVLARRFGFGFEPDLIMQDGRDDYQSCMQQAFGIDNKYSVFTRPLVLQGASELLDGITTIAFQSSCTIEPDTSASTIAATGEPCSKMKARGIRDNYGRFRHINEYYCDKKLNAPFLIATCSGRGRVVGIGSYKMLANEFLSGSGLDNRRLLVNCLRWLSFMAGPVPLKPQASKIEAPISIFYSYAHQDENLRDQLEQHLALLRRQGLISGWLDRQIMAGQEWADQISEHLESARIILLLVSASFLASDYCYGKEMGRALERHEAGEATVIPVIVRPCDWHEAPFAKLQALPKDAKAVTSWKNRDAAWTDVARGIRRAVEAISANQR